MGALATGPMSVGIRCVKRPLEVLWCGREDSNLHDLRRQDLNLVRLPIPPRPRTAGILSDWRAVPFGLSRPRPSASLPTPSQAVRERPPGAGAVAGRPDAPGATGDRHYNRPMNAVDTGAGGPRAPWLGAADPHYENFPVGSWLMPAPLRPAVAAIYRFARYADDVADEGTATPAERLTELDHLRQALDPATRVSHPIVTQLLPFIARHRLDTRHFVDLLSAFAQDITTTRHADWAALIDYSARSANPVGRLMLELQDQADAGNCARSDAICTALQLINFAQDVAVDWHKDRVYLPQDRLQAAGLGDQDIAAAVAAGRSSVALREVIATFCDDVSALLDQGRDLPSRMSLRFALELRAILAGGTRILERLRAVDYDPIARRPVISWRDGPALLALAIGNRPRSGARSPSTPTPSR